MFAIDVETDVGQFALRVTLPVASGTTVIVGPNGAGKTTLLMSLLGAIRPRRGKIRLEDTTLFSHHDGVDLPMEERRVGYVPQKYALFPHMTVAANVAFGMRGCSKRERAKRVEALLGELGIAHLAGRRPPTLSGGESQRVALARALAIEPRALLLDEPTAALDAGARKMVRQFLSDRLRRLQIPTIVVSHDLDEVEALGGRIAVLEKGRIVQVGTLDELRRMPSTPFVEHFVDAGSVADTAFSMPLHVGDSTGQQLLH